MQIPTQQELETLRARLEEAMGPDVRVAVAPLDDDDRAQAASGSDELFPEEAVAVAKAIPRRVLEFATGRRLARELLEALGFPRRPMPAKPDRSPEWPSGAIGAITHTRGLCVVVAARGGPDESLGIDVEPRTDLQTDLRPLVCTPNEIRWLEQQPAAEQGCLGKLLFSAKETLYKCQHPLTGTFLGFHQAEVELSPDRQHFEARILHPVAARLGDTPLRGRVIETERWLVTTMRWPPGPSGSGPTTTTRP